jgi:hypothetical protein
MTVKLPMVGTLSGRVTAKEIAGQAKERQTEEQPAVVVEDLNESGSASPSSTESASADDSDRKGGASEEAEASADDADETEAARILTLAKAYLNSDLREQAIKKLEKIVEEYPDTKAAREAKKLLPE